MKQLPDTKLDVGQKETIERMLHEKAKQVTDDDIQIIHDKMDDKLSKMKSNSNIAVKFLRKAKLLYEMLFDKEYKLEWSTKAVIVSALLYFVSPIDVFPDFIPGIGYIDDTFMLVIVYNTLEKEIRKYINNKDLTTEEYF